MVGAENITQNSLNPLPIELTYFKAYTNDDRISFKWETASEINNDYFTVEKSLDGFILYVLFKYSVIF